MIWRLNPRSVFDREIRPALSRRGWRAMGRALPRKPLGCGTFGCAFRLDPGWIMKVTTDKAEVRMVDKILRLRKASPVNTRSVRESLRPTGVSVALAAKLPGIVGYSRSPVRAGRVWQYPREDVDPAVDMRDSARVERMAEIREGLDLWFYGKHRIDTRRFLAEFPRLRLIVATSLYLEYAHDLRIEDVHEEQVGRVRITTKLHRKGEYVLYDGQVD